MRKIWGVLKMDEDKLSRIKGILLHYHSIERKQDQIKGQDTSHVNINRYYIELPLIKRSTQGIRSRYQKIPALANVSSIF